MNTLLRALPAWLGLAAMLILVPGAISQTAVV